MVTRKKKPPALGRARPSSPQRGAPVPSSAQEFTVVLEDLRSHFKAFGEALDLVRDEMRRGFEQVDRRLAPLERDVAGLKTDMAQVKTDVAGLKTDMAQVKTDVAGLKTDVALIKTAVLEEHRELATKVSREEVERIVQRAVSPSRS
jgi:CBS-domain-containing membrane protein